MKNILITGSLGQIGTELTAELIKYYGESRVIATDIRPASESSREINCAFFQLDCLDGKALTELVNKYRINAIFHLAALLSATAEKDPRKAWDINMGSLISVLETARERNCSVFIPSSIAAFGPSSPKAKTPQDTLQRPSTIYGITKVSGELLCDYYFEKFGLDTRGLRFPGLISHSAPPGGGTTDYAVEIYHQALKTGNYTCFLGPNTFLDMMYMPDAVRAVVELMEADPGRLVHRNAFNIAAMSVSPKTMADSISKYVPAFRMDYAVDPLRQKLADSWPDSLDDSAAREEWGWKPGYSLDAMTKDMLSVLSPRYKTGLLAV